MSMMLCGEDVRGLFFWNRFKNIFNGEPDRAKCIGIVHLQDVVHLQEVQVH